MCHRVQCQQINSEQKLYLNMEKHILVRYIYNIVK